MNPAACALMATICVAPAAHMPQYQSASDDLQGGQLPQTISTDERLARDYFIAALRLAEQGGIEEALETATKGLVLDENNPDGLNLIGQLYEQLERGVEAEEAYLRASAADPDWAMPYRNLGNLYVARGQPSLALAPFSRAADLAPQDPVAHAMLANALRAAGHRNDAVLAFQRAWELDPESVQLAVDIATTQIDAGDLAGAIGTAEIAVERSPGETTSFRLLASTLSASELIDDQVRAPAAFRQAIALDSERADLWLGLGTAYDRLELLTQAEQAYRRSIDLGLDNARVRYELGQILSRQNQFAPAVGEYGRAIDADVRFAPAYYARGKALFELNRAEEALGDFEYAIGISPGDPDPVLAAVQVYMVQGDLASSERLLGEIASTTTSKRAEISIAIGMLRLRQGRNEEVVKVLAPVLKTDPQLIEARYLTGQALLKLGRIDEGRTVLSDYQRRFLERRVQEVDRLRMGLMDRARIYVLRGRVYTHEGQFDLALEQLESAAELAPGNADVWQALAKLHDLRREPAAAAVARRRGASLRGSDAN